MLDIDKWPVPFQWAFGVGVFLGGLLVAFFGARAARTKPADAEHVEIEQLRDEKRDNALRQEFSLGIAAAKDAMGQALSATRQSFYGEFKALRAEYDKRLRDLEIDNTVLEAKVEDLLRRRPRS